MRYWRSGLANLILYVVPVGLAAITAAACANDVAPSEPVLGEPALGELSAEIARATAAVEAAQAAARGLQPPAGCTEIEPGEFLNGVELTPVRYERSPTYRTQLTAVGDPAVTDSLVIRLDAATPLGLYSLAGSNANTFTCEQCVFGTADQISGNLYVADAGTLLLAAKLSAEQTVGALANVTMRQSVPAAPLSGPYTGSAPVAGGACYWIRFATWNTIRPFGCNPEHDSLTSHLPGFTCVADSRAANDGTLERSTGTKQQDAACAYTPATDTAPAASDCATGYACTDMFTDDRVCLKTCDFMAADPGCDAGRVCGVQGICIEQSVLEPIGFAFDPALIGESCALDFAEFCGTEGARGVCLALNGPGTGICFPYERARSDCGPGEELGFVSYPLAGGGFDRTYGFCFPN